MEQEDLIQLVDALTSVLKPQMRLDTNEIVAVRLEAGLQSIRSAVQELADSTEQRLHALALTVATVAQADRTELLKEIEDVRIKSEAEVASVQAQVERMGGEIKSDIQSGRSQIEGSVRDGESETRNQIQQVEERVTGLIRALPAPIAPPAPLALVVGDELSPPMLDAMELAVKQIVAPLVKAQVDALRTEIKDADEPDEFDPEAACADLQSQMTEIDKTVKQHGMMVTAHSGQIKSVEQEMVALQDAVDGKADKKDLVPQVDMAPMAAQLADHGERIKTVEQEMVTLQDAVDGKADKKDIVAPVTLDLTPLENMVGDLAVRAADNEEHIGAAHVRITAYDEAFKSLPAQLADQVQENISAAIEAKVQAGVQVLLDATAKDFSALAESATTFVAEASEAVPVQVEAALAGQYDALQVKLLGELRGPLTDNAVEVAVASANESLTKMLAEFEPLMSEKATELAAQAGMRVAASLVPSLVDAQAPELILLVVQRATEAATKAASEAATRAGTASAQAAAGDVLAQAENVAKAAAEPIAMAAATVAAATLREGMMADLDPTARVDAAVTRELERVTAELGEAVGEAIDKQIAEEMPKVFINLQAKMQVEFDRLPIPEKAKDGKDGKITPAVPWESGVKYKLGTWVTHAKGVWTCARAWTDTEPTGDNRDWDCIVNGIKSLRYEMSDDLRTLRCIATTTDGTEHADEVVLNIPVIRGTYSEEHTYGLNDIVTSNGSWWSAKKIGKLARPMTNADEWQLQIKHGQNGKAAEMPSRSERFKGMWLPQMYHEGDVVENGTFRWLAMRSNREQPLRSDDNWTRMGASQ